MIKHSMAMRAALSFAALAAGLMFAVAAYADPLATAESVNDAFYKASAACDIPAVLDLYEDDAVVIWPGQGEYAVGKPAFRKNPQNLLRRRHEAVVQSSQQRRAAGR